MFAARHAGWIAVAVLTAFAPAAGAAQGAPGKLSLELNKLEPAGESCRAYFVAENGTAEPVRELRLDTFIFNGAGVIAKRILLSFPDIRPGRAKVVPFDLAGSACGDLGRLLVNDVLACTGASGAPIAGCAERLATSSKAAAKLDY